MIGTRKEAVKTSETVETVEIIETGKDSKESESGEYPENLIQFSCIWYSIIFQKKFVPMLVLFDSGSEGNTIYPTFT